MCKSLPIKKEFRAIRRPVDLWQLNGNTNEII
jgi:hypothetical protein